MIEIEQTTIETLDLENLEENLGEFVFEDELETRLKILDERHRELTIAANTIINGRKSWLQNVKNLLLPSQKN
ncbi:MAG: hypothetical protein WBG70_18425 [Spirulinaceae cyanobacterium]